MAALKAKAEKDAIAFGFGCVVEMEPVDAMLWMVHSQPVKSIGCNSRSMRMAQAPHDRSPDRARLWTEERDRLARTAKAALDAGVAERAVRVAERTGRRSARPCAVCSLIPS